METIFQSLSSLGTTAAAFQASENWISGLAGSILSRIMSFSTQRVAVDRRFIATPAASVAEVRVSRLPSTPVCRTSLVTDSR